MRRTLPLLLVLAVLSVLAPARAQDNIEDARAQQEQARREAAAVAAELDLLEAEDLEVRDALAALDAFIAQTEADIDDAAQAVRVAEAQAAAADAEAGRLGDEIGLLKVLLADRAVAAYVQTDDTKLEILLNSADPADAELREFLLAVANGATTDLSDQLRVAQADQRDAEERAELARADAEARQAEIQAHLTDLEAARADQAELQAEIQARIEVWEGEVASLNAMDAELTAFIVAEQDKIRAAEEQARLAAEEEARRIAAQEEAERLAAEAEEEARRIAAEEEAERLEAERLEAEQQALQDQQDPPAEDPETEPPADETETEPPADDGEPAADDETDPPADDDETDPPAEDDETDPPAEDPPPASGPISMIWPIGGTVTSGFGYRIHPIFGTERFHSGLDINGSSGQPIAAAAAGTVLSATSMSGYGNTVIVDHGNGISTLYAHQSSMAVATGQSVAQGEVLGYVGSTGWSTGPHLHFEVRIDGVAADPLGYL